MVCKDSRDRMYMLQMLDRVIDSMPILESAEALSDVEPQFDLSHLMVWVRGHTRGIADGGRLAQSAAAELAMMASRN